ncbi:hypothetical protein JTB14_018513 [Gonioctena quinquepunctata]|nr:hypothetical protein JTB14_018513 [Gonioctena quinquepunctata]
MSTSGFLVLVLVLLVTCEAEPATEFVEASGGGTASLPCNLTPTVTPDKISVVLWYKGAEESPIYKYDVRGSQPVRWADPSLQNRFFLKILDDHRAAMSISPTKLSDEHIFHCRVDFMKSPTRITHVNLTIIVFLGYDVFAYFTGKAFGVISIPNRMLRYVIALGRYHYADSLEMSRIDDVTENDEAAKCGNCNRIVCAKQKKSGCKKCLANSELVFLT